MDTPTLIAVALAVLWIAAIWAIAHYGTRRDIAKLPPVTPERAAQVCEWQRQSKREWEAARAAGFPTQRAATLTPEQTAKFREDWRKALKAADDFEQRQSRGA